MGESVAARSGSCLNGEKQSYLTGCVHFYTLPQAAEGDEAENTEGDAANEAAHMLL